MEDVKTRRRILLSLSKLGSGLQEFNARKLHLHLTSKNPASRDPFDLEGISARRVTSKMSWNNHDDVIRNANSV